MSRIRRIFLIVLDGVGIGALPDASSYGDAGSNTLVHTAEAVGGLALPNLARWGLGNLAPLPGVPSIGAPAGAWGIMAEAAPGKDTTTGHWELAGLVLKSPFPVYPGGFPAGLIEAFTRAIGRGVLGNRAASGTEIIAALGAEHLATGKPIVYTSADSVFQIAAHEDLVPVEQLYDWCLAARSLLTGEHAVARVIARPFTGKPGAFVRTGRRRDFSLPPPGPTILDALSRAGMTVMGFGKIEDIFAHRGLTASNHTIGNTATLAAVEEAVAADFQGLAFANCVDFDMLYGHRNDPRGFARALAEADAFLGRIAAALRPGDALCVTADHGCDPTAPGTDHTREYVPLLVTGPGLRPAHLGTRASFADLGASVLELLGVADPWPVGISFAGLLCK
ncbi:MAG: phosphopentomutase [Patescibacteria group bacterium]